MADKLVILMLAVILLAAILFGCGVPRDRSLRDSRLLPGVCANLSRPGWCGARQGTPTLVAAGALPPGQQAKPLRAAPGATFRHICAGELIVNDSWVGCS